MDRFDSEEWLLYAKLMLGQVLVEAKLVSGLYFVAAFVES